MEKVLITKQRIISELTRSPHGNLQEYVPIGREAAKQEPEFFAHLIAWNEKNGKVRDSKVALPLIALIGYKEGAWKAPGHVYDENAMAHLALLDPRNFVRALRFARELKVSGHRMRALVERYLRVREESFGRWERVALQHRASLKTLYALFHVRPAAFADAILFKGVRPPGSVFEAVANLKLMSPIEAAGTIIEKRIPFLVAVSAMGSRMRDTEVVMALIERMSPAELINNTKMLERLGIKEVPALRAAYEAGLQRVAEDKKGSTLKTQRAAEAMTDEKLKAKLVVTQEKQLHAISVEGNWLVLADKSQSMVEAIEASKLVAATLAKVAKGDVWLIFFDHMPRAIEVTGLTYDEIKTMTLGVTANGATSIGCGVQYAFDKGWDVSGIAIVSDGAENTAPMFVDAYSRLCKSLDRSVPVYLYWTKCTQPDSWNNNPERLGMNMQAAGHDMQVFDLRGGVDYYSLPNLVQTMRASRYSLLDDIMNTPLLTLNEVFKDSTAEEAA